MKNPFRVLLLGIAMALMGVVVSFVSAMKYDHIFTSIIIFDFSAISCFVYSFRAGGKWKIAALFFGLIVFYTLMDVVLRFAFGIRVLDIMG